MSWGGFILTNAGRNLLAKVQAGEMAELNITRFGIGDGNYSGSYNTIANLVSQKQSVPLRAKKAKAQYVNIEGYFSNEGLAEGFYFREWGIFAMNGAQEILYAYDNAGTDAEYVAPDGSIRYEKLLKAALVITVDVNVTIDTSGVVYATVEELKNYLLTVGDGKDVTVTFEEAEIETDIKSGDKLSVMFGKILKKFKTVTSNIGNKADLITVDKDNLVDAINEVKTQNNTLATYKGFLSAPSTVVSLANNVLTTINFGTPLYDTGFYSSGNPSRITIPANIKKVKVKGIASFASSANGHRLLLIRKNGVAQSGEAQVILPATSDGTIFVYTESAVLNVVQGDYFEFRVRQTSGGALDLNTASWFALEVVE